MSDSQDMRYDLLVARVRLGIYVLSALTMLVGFVYGVWSKEWALATFVVLIGYVVNNLSDIGRPVIINLFHEIAEKTRSGANNPTGYL